MWRLKINYFWLALAFFFLLSSVPSFGDSYLITSSEITQILDECATLRLELSVLKEISQKDKASLQRLEERLQKAEDSLAKAEKNSETSQSDLTSVRAQLGEVKTQLAELRASLAKSKRAELWERIKVGGICLGAGASIGVIVGLVLGSR